MAVTAVVFEGGQAANSLQNLIRSVRQAVVLDTLAKLKSCPDVAAVILGTDNEELASEAARLGVTCTDTGRSRPFHFGRELARVVGEFGLDRVIYLGGAAAPLITPAEVGWIARTLAERERAVILNNPQSADLIAFTPASILASIDLPGNDNFLGYLLKEAGLERILCPNSPGINFDLDTPTDLMILALQPGAGPRASDRLKRLAWDVSHLRAARDVLGTDSSEVSLVGRVGSPVVSFINSNFKCRLRVFSEERGMKALGRDERGEVVSLIGHFLNEVGPRRFFEYLAGMCGAVFFDSRVVFAHLRGRVSEWDRFHSDLGQFEAISDPFVRDFTREARTCGVPVVLGGHSVVSGGLWLIAESLLGNGEGR